MTDSPLLPPAPASTADVAAALSMDSLSAAGAGGESFDSVLEAQLKDRSQAEPSESSDTAAPPDASFAKEGAGAALATFLADLPGVPVPVGLVERSPVMDSAPGSTGARPVASAQLEAVGPRALEQRPPEAGRAREGLFPAGVTHEAHSAGATEAPGAFHSLLEATVRADLLQPPHTTVAPRAAVESAVDSRLPVPASIGSREWSAQFTERVTWVAQARHSSAELVLNPPQLGPVEVHVSVSVDQVATLSFHAAHPAVREAIQGSLPRLQEAFASSGLQLADVFVGSGSAGPGDQRRSAAGGGTGRLAQRGGFDATTGVVASGLAAVHQWAVPGRVDLFA